MAKSDYICCDVCNCKFFYDRKTSGEWLTVICYDCAKKQGWQPIETAPDDSERTLLAANEIELLRARVAELESQLDLARNQLAARIGLIRVSTDTAHEG
jgi:hypothetical protein